MRVVLEGLTAIRDKLIASGVDVYCFDLGNPRGPVLPQAKRRVQIEAWKDDSYRYQPSAGLLETRKAFCSRFERRHDISFDPNSNVVVTRGSKAGLANLMLLLLSPGDKAIVPNPCYAIHQDGVINEGRSKPVLYECGPGIDIVENIGHAFDEAKDAKFLLLNFPHNPTGVMLSKEELREVAKIAKKKGAKIISDLAYDDLVFTGSPAVSIFEAVGIDGVVETHSMSKSHNMAGQLGFAAGDERILKALAEGQNDFGYGVSASYQLGGAVALNEGDELVAANREDYITRDAILTDGLTASYWSMGRSLSTIYKWVKIPQGYDDAEKFCENLLYGAHVAIWPASGFGEGWERYVRFALVEPQDRIPKAVEAIAQFING